MAESKPAWGSSRNQSEVPRGRACGEVLLADALSKVLRTAGIKKRNAVTAISERWEEVVGVEVARHTLVRGYRSGVLGIEVDSAPWLQELASFRKQEILDRLRRVVPEARVYDLKFRVHG